MPAPDEDEQFTYDILGNRITLNPRVGANVVYASNTVNEYTDIGGVTPLYDDCGNLTKDINGYTYHYDNDNCAAKIKKTNDTVDVAIYTYDALGRPGRFGLAVLVIPIMPTIYKYCVWVVRCISKERSASGWERQN